MNIRELADREHFAEANRKNAEERWRRAWWATTLALGAITTKAERAEAVTTVEEVTEQSRGWIQSRARTGEAFQSMPKARVSQLPPRMSIELVRNKVPITAVVVKDMLQAEKDGVSLREFSSRITGKSWADTPEGASEDAIKKMIASRPELVGRLVAENEEASQAHDSEVLSHGEHVDGFVKPADWNSPKHVLTRLTLAVKQLRKECDGPGDLSENARATIDWALAELSAIKEGRDFVGEIEAWLESSTS